FYVTTEAEHGLRTREWIRKNIPAQIDVSVDDVTSHFATLLLAGPEASQIMLALLETEWDSENADPSRGFMGIVAGIPSRIHPDETTHCPGWQIHVPMDGVYGIYRHIHETGDDAGLLDCGTAALRMLRL